MTLYRGTREEKRAFLQDLIDRHEETLDKICARRLIWRQRKCWMWRGGFYAGALAGLTAAVNGARVRLAHDALIPDSNYYADISGIYHAGAVLCGHVCWSG